MDSNNIGKLSTELQLLILLQIPTIQDLISLIRASPQHYRVFLPWKDQVISSVIRQMLGPEVLVDALAAVEASVKDFRNADRETINAFLEKYKVAREVGPPNQKLPLSTSVSLCRLHHIIEDDIRGYIQRATTVFKQCTQSISSVGVKRHSKASRNFEWEKTPLSNVEHGRFRRSFYRFELFGRLFNGPENRAPSKIFSTSEQASLFLGQFPLWQVEEISCIRDYFRRRITEVYEQVDDAYIQDVLTRHPLPSKKKIKRWTGKVAVNEQLDTTDIGPSGMKRKREMEEPAMEEDRIDKDHMIRGKKRKLETEESTRNDEIIATDPTLYENKRKSETAQPRKEDGAIASGPVTCKTKRQRATENSAWEEMMIAPGKKKRKLESEETAREEVLLTPWAEKPKRETEEPASEATAITKDTVAREKKRKQETEEGIQEKNGTKADEKDREIGGESEDQCPYDFLECDEDCFDFDGVDKFFSESDN